MGGQPLAQRLQDKAHSWGDLQKLIPNMVLEGLCGYPFSCPDMIGGGEWTSFLDPSTLDQELTVRSAQCHALMPMMQFSVAPWRKLDSTHLEAVKKAVALRAEFTPLIMRLAREATATGEPIMKCMEYEFTGQGFENTKDQFMLGSAILVAPMLEKGKTSPDVKLPSGKWKTPDGKIFKGGRACEFPVALEQLLYFEKANLQNRCNL
jgi:alpha-glucosidase (family GH31 glycosyl hydrolase)